MFWPILAIIRYLLQQHTGKNTEMEASPSQSIILHYTTLYYVMLRYVVLCVKLCHIMLYYNILYYITKLYYTILHNTTLRYATLYYSQSVILYYLLTYLLTPWCRVLLEKLTGLQLVKKFPTFYGTRRFITALTSVCHLSLSWASTRVHCTILHYTIPFYTTLYYSQSMILYYTVL